MSRISKENSLNELKELFTQKGLFSHDSLSLMLFQNRFSVQHKSEFPFPFYENKFELGLSNSKITKIFNEYDVNFTLFVTKNYLVSEVSEYSIVMWTIFMTFL